MEGRKRTTAQLLFCSIILVILFGIESSEGKILSQQIYTEGLTAPYTPNFPFYNNNLLYLLVGVNGGDIGIEPSLVQYASSGAIARNLTFPLPCIQSDCVLEATIFGLIEDTAYVNIMKIETPSSAISCMLYAVNLNSFSIVQTSTALNETNHYCGYTLPTWAPYNSTRAIVSQQWFDYQTLSFVEEEKLPFFIHNYGGSTPVLSDQNLIFYEQDDGYNNIFTSQNVETLEQQVVPYISDAQFSVFLGSNTTNVALTYYAYPQGVNLTILDASLATYPNRPQSFSMIENGYQAGMLADSANNLFFFGSENYGTYADNLLISQYKIDANNVPTLYDQITLSEYYPLYYYPGFYSILSWGINTSSQQFAHVVKNENQQLVLLVVDYDNNISSSANFSA